jgi:hypothetical protein
MGNYNCRFCGKKYESLAAIGGHVQGCILNPRKKEILAKIIKTRVENNRIKDPIVTKGLLCKNCKKSFKQTATVSTFNRGRGRSCCTNLCAHRYAQSFVDLSKLSETMKVKSSWNRGKKIKTLIKCKTCGKEIRKNTYGFCKICINKDPEHLLRLSKALKGKTGGYRTNSGNKRFHKSRYQGIWMDSGWELEFAKRCDSLGLIWERGKRILKYKTEDGVDHKYHPDFYIPSRDVFIETTGHQYPEKFEKLRLVKIFNPNIRIQVIDNLKDIKTYI